MLDIIGIAIGSILFYGLLVMCIALTTDDRKDPRRN